MLLPGIMMARSPTGRLIGKSTVSSIYTSKRYQTHKLNANVKAPPVFESESVFGSKDQMQEWLRALTICNLPAIATLPTARWKYVPARVEKAMTRKMRARKRVILTRREQMRKIKEIRVKKTR
jgi:hypothetical protein